jgi:hypothetical protein
LDVSVIESPTVDRGNLSSTDTMESAFSPVVSVLDARETAFELGLWLSGLDSFLNVRSYLFGDENRAPAATRDWSKEFRLTHSTLLLCAKLNFELAKAIADRGPVAPARPDKNGAENFLSEIAIDEIDDFSRVLKEAVLLNEGLLRGAPLKFGEWSAWGGQLSEKLKSSPMFGRLIVGAEKIGDESIPAPLVELLKSKTLTTAEQTDLQVILRRFSRILKWLSVVGRMLRADEPLKVTLLIFSRIYEQTQEMIGYINNRLLRFPDEEAELFGTLDGAAYTASIELKKVYSQELTGIMGIRPSPTVYARIETAYSLLNDSFQHILAGFARLIEPTTDPASVFPIFKVKTEQSITLRKDLWKMLQSVQAAEQGPEKMQIERVNKDLTAFLGETIDYLFYKDKETVERFVEEVLIARDKKDLVPILHRFGAYLETLFGQINMRAVLANHPFDQSKGF